MTVFNLNGTDGAWFDLEGGGRIQLRLMDGDTLRAIHSQTAKTRVEYKRVEGKAERFEVEQIDHDLRTALFWDHVIVAWDNFLDAHGETIPCTRETKLLLLSRSARFAKFVGECLEKLNADQAMNAEALEKN